MAKNTKRASIRDLRYHFAVVEDLLGEGHEVHITKRKRVIARLLPAEKAHAVQRPDFLGRLKKLCKGKTLRVSAAELLAAERDRF